ncbi:LuxR family transcriptional regulator [Cognatiyoonia sp. IB215182]|uniref:LuxR family transcriptional regulator n=1 Tax=Cognatiyoonia sp. IB215182 TaxID=3097353 RepID=UPI002A18623F|nr:LuxR family transcriptional regulator [Cognatiyoonia sp. IB215182]MDX8355489.1 LuxR family transcriptional regulator [Cognatiyoonia sp. IB215182]
MSAPVHYLNGCISIWRSTVTTGDNEFMHLDISQEFVENAEKFEGTDDKPGFLRAFGQRFGLSDIAYMHLSNQKAGKKQVELVTTYSSDWEKRYVEMGYDESDPVVRNSFRGILPLDWEAVTSGDKSTKDFFGEAAEFGIGTQGVSIPIRTPEGSEALFSVSSMESSREWHSIKKHLLSDLVYLGFLLHSSLAKKCPESGVPLKLSPRERDVLTWASRGKSCWETGKILGLSERTVNFYIGNASAKLGAATKTQAVAIALRKRLILHNVIN